MANEKIVNREVLKKVREKFQQKIENATIVAGQARTIAAVSEESGTMQDAAFINQGTGTNNNTSIVDTSPVGKNIQKEGYSIVYNQLISLDLSRLVSLNTSGTWNDNVYSMRGVTFEVQSDKIIVNGTATGGNVAFILIRDESVTNHKYLLKGCPAGGSTSTYCLKFIENFNNADTGNGVVANFEYKSFLFYVFEGISFTNAVLKPKLCDLTQWFNGKIPSDLLSYPAHFSWHYSGDLTYNVGQIKDCNGRYLECGQSRQIWDEECTIDNNTLIATNLTHVIPNTQYYVYSPKDLTLSLRDRNGDHVEFYTATAGQVFTTPSYCWFIKITVAEYGAAYNHDITLSLYYSTGDGYDKYYPYVAPVTYDTGNEVLRSIPVAGGDDIKDIKEPDGTIIRRVGTRAYISGDENDSSVLTDKTTTYYELETPTTETGTAFIDNIQINDYSYMLWKDTNGDYVVIPQGVKIFYPADYVLLLDSLNTVLEGDATNVVTKDYLTEQDFVEKTEIDTTNFGTITSTAIVANAFYRNNIAVSGGVNATDIIFVQMSNNAVYPAINNNTTQLVIYSGSDLSSLTITKVWKVNT